ncbi:hypothetical protein HPP92_018163 [Vanilla planifolia]|uniref:U3 small nucleolar ribonucleoprotein protein MPP10 n=1 Tax=Vanilla planifolia TaxID=51239 RepID=A0A835UQC6_VANPL|nr:hypothetical protein HPP92_018163 [Vanilla planifolia]
MMAASTAPNVDAGEEALKLLCTEEPPAFLTPSTKLSAASRSAARYLFSSLLPYCSKPPVEDLLVDDKYDAEQIWSQIDLLSRPIISLLRRDVKRLQREPSGGPVRRVEPKEREGEDEQENLEAGGGEEDDDVDDGFEDEGEDGEEMNEAEEEDGERKNVLEDQFLKIKELEEYLENDEAREYGLPRKGRKLEGNEKENVNDEDEGNEEEEEDEDDEMFEDMDDDDDDAENARYEDFFGRKNVIHKRSGATREKTAPDVQEDQISVEEDKDGMEINTQNIGTLSTHEKELLKLRSKIEEMEKANLEPKLWTMQGEVTAVKRPKNSALEVDLDFEHNVRPPPVITEEVTASIEDLIKKKRIIEGNFDDVQRAPKLPSRAPKELKELDETKSKKGLAEIYEEEYAQNTGLASAPLSSSDEHKKEASLLFRRLCLKLDALAHFQFAPKPVIEEMSIQANVPALAMEEIAPVAVSDVAMLAPEEVFQGKGNIKEEAELTQADRKKRRATKKRKFKAEKAKIEARKPRPNAHQLQPNGNEYS